MIVKVVETTSGNIAIVNSDTPIITDGQSALDFAVNIAYAHNCRNIAIDKRVLSEDFFHLSTGLAGEVVQKFVNFRYRLAIFGDFSGYASKALHDFIYESNKGNHLFFTPDENTATERLRK